ncbi:MAG: ATP-binding cassette domain-containing protein [Candidatus Marinimicrobia bacterium]|nr:ATP-binding cassette domain-containing protein [Candidatus Neomarinimicrobiota bacterium]
MIELRNVSLTYQRGPGVFDINFKINAGELAFLVGPSGAGKSTVLKLMYAELVPQEGEVEINGYITSRIRRNRIPGLRRTLGLVFQDFRLLPDRNAYDNVALPLHIMGLPHREIRERTYSALGDVGLSERVHHYPRELSGGEQQRVAIARAVVKNPDIILADEPTGNLDAATALETLDLLTYLAEDQGCTVVVATHDYTLMTKKRGRLIEISEGRLLD